VKPAVFPVPVCADANTSLPSKMGGIAFVVLEKDLCILLLMAHQINLMS
jgi:hypothetical protein